MKKITYIAVLMVTLIIGSCEGCAKTWNGVKQDAGRTWDVTAKKAVHEATA